MKIKATRSIVGVVGSVRFPCGCQTFVALGKATTVFGTRHLTQHACKEWKRHKYELSDAERGLAIRLKRHIRALRSSDQKGK